MSRHLSRMEQASGCARTAHPFFLEILGDLQTSKERDYLTLRNHYSLLKIVPVKVS